MFGRSKRRGHRAARQGQELGGAQPGASSHLSSWKELDAPEEKSKMNKNNLFPFPVQEIAKGPTGQLSPPSSGEDLMGAKAALEGQV